jgi:hypothetical protein
MKPRSDSRLFKLSPEKQAQLYDWIHKLGYVKAKELAALPTPDGFGLKTHLNSLCRFVARYSEMQKEREFFNILRCASGELHPQTLRAAETMAHQMAFNIATSPPTNEKDLDKFRAISRWVLAIKSEQQKEAYRNLALDQLAHLTKLHERNKPS